MGKKTKSEKAAEKAAAKAAKAAAKAAKAGAETATADEPKAAKAPKEKKPKAPSLLERRLATLAADAARTPPTVPIPQILLEAERVYREAKRAKSDFAKLAGFDVDDLEGLRELAAALDDAEAEWKRHRLDKKASTLGAERREAEDLRATAIASGRYLLRHDPRAQSDLDQIQEGEGLADLIQDLRDLHRFIAAHGDAFAHDQYLPEGAAQRLVLLADQLAAGADSDASDLAQSERNRRYWVLAHALSEVRAAARYLFRNKPKKLDLFVSGHAARRAVTSRPRPAAPTPPTS